MKSPLLIVTPQANFGALLRNSLDASSFDSIATSDFSAAIHFVRNNDCPTVILDTELEDVELSVLDIGYALRQLKPDIQFVLVIRAGQELDSASLTPVATLVKPVSIPDLNALLLSLATPASARKPAEPAAVVVSNGADRILAETSALMWLKDVSKAAQHLTRLTLESSAQAALITRQDELWAYAGQLSREAAQELAASIQRYWDVGSESDLLRFVRLQATEAQHMLYARKLSENMILALVFDAETPFSTIRSQAGKLVKNLSASAVVEPSPDPLLTAAPVAAASLMPVNLPALDDGDEEDEDLPPLTELLGDVPPPIPPPPAPRGGSIWNQTVGNTTVLPLSEQSVASSPKSVSVPVQFSNESSPPLRRKNAQKRPMPAMDETFGASYATPQVDVQMETDPAEIPDDMQVTRKQEAQRDPQAVIETRPQLVAESMTEVAHRILLEPASPSLVNLTYACLLLPRFDHHHLLGDTAARINEWVPQVCVAFGWRLEHISVRPDYLQWVARVPPSTAPGYIMRIIRQQTSDRIFNEFPRFKADNPSGDFWAPGYLIMGSSQPHPQKLVRDFIKQTRARQGLGYE